MTEVWKDIDGYEGLYQVSNLGNVKSLKYGGSKHEKVLTPKVNNCGRLWVELFNCGRKKQFLIHRLVANAFIPNPESFPQINHIDENPKNNCVDNLEWCTGSYNIRYYRERHPCVARDRKSTGRYKRKLGISIIQFDMDGNAIKTWDDARTISIEKGFSQWSITQCCDGKRHTAYGFKWQYAI